MTTELLTVHLEDNIGGPVLGCWDLSRYSFTVADSVKRFEGLPRIIHNTLFLHQTSMTSFHNIHKHFEYIGGNILLPLTTKSHVLGILKIKGLQTAGTFSHIIHTQRKQAFLEAHQAINIVNKHLAGDRNIHACQEELIEAGLKEFARL